MTYNKVCVTFQTYITGCILGKNEFRNNPSILLEPNEDHEGPGRSWKILEGPGVLIFSQIHRVLQIKANQMLKCADMGIS